MHLDQCGHNGVFHHGCLQPLVVKDLFQLLMDPELQGLEERWVVLEKVRPIQNHRITESQNGRGWKGPLWVI